MRPSSKPLIKFHERTEGSPQAIKAWFYAGRSYGHEFVYPKNKARALAVANNTPVPAMPTELTPDTNKPDVTLTDPEVIAMDDAPLMAEKPTGEEVDLSQAFLIALAAPSATQSDMSETLPATATQLPLVALAGLLMLGTAVALRLAASRAN